MLRQACSQVGRHRAKFLHAPARCSTSKASPLLRTRSFWDLRSYHHPLSCTDCAGTRLGHSPCQKSELWVPWPPDVRLLQVLKRNSPHTLVKTHHLLTACCMCADFQKSRTVEGKNIHAVGYTEAASSPAKLSYASLRYQSSQAELAGVEALTPCQADMAAHRAESRTLVTMAQLYCVVLKAELLMQWQKQPSRGGQMALKRALRKALHSKQPLIPSWIASPRLKGRWRCTRRTGFQGTTDGCVALQIATESTHTAQQYSWLIAPRCKSHRSTQAALGALICCVFS